ncbi:hypothetical protein QVD17_21281 [Tagetes erecta]|uniref:Uncharacterized protein n=1 Tax=Tagetes erecta TaxID=13708 RepID=A0AAD8KQQ1_TARER|nr:hypothetical protein QVD17_21281 [Tagetes erecta]
MSVRLQEEEEIVKSDEIQILYNNEDELCPDLDGCLERLDLYLLFLGFNQSSYCRFGISWVSFLMIGVLLPVFVVLSNCRLKCDLYQVEAFELLVVSSHASLAASALLCLSHNLRKYGIRKFLFLDHYNAHLQTHYLHKISESKRALLLWFLPCLILKVGREVTRMMYMQHDHSWWQPFAILLTLTFSWTYVTIIFLSSCLVFHLVCNLQIIHFDDYANLLERETDVLVFIQEHARLRHHLSKISHRFRIFLLLVFILVTSSQFATLFQITEFRDKVTFINGGDFAVSSIAQVVGVILCLNAAAKISHRAQGIASLASRWHALASCGPDDTSQMRFSNRNGNFEAANNLLTSVSSESDMEAMNYIPLPTNAQLTSYLASYHRRQAFLMYLQNNPGGITLYGWTVDRSLINTIFFIELSLVLFVLGRTTVFTTTN